MNPEQHDRNAAMMARMGHQTNGSVPMGPPMPTRLRPNGGAGPGIQPIPRPTPPKLPPVDRLSGPNTKIPPKKDPTNKYHNGGEKMIGAGDSGDSELSGIKASLSLVLLIILAASVFVIKDSYRFFWLVLIGLGFIMMLGNRVYTDLYNASIDTENTDEDQKKKYANFAGGVLYAIYILFAVVMACILLVLLWKVYGQVTKRSNLVNNKEPKKDVEIVELDEEEMMLPGPRPPPDDDYGMGGGMSKKERKRMRKMRQQQMMNRNF